MTNRRGPTARQGSLRGGRIGIYPGQYFDAETGLHYNYHRYYDPGTGRYLTADPIGLAGLDLNPYGYVLGNPVNLTDPRGLIAGADPFGVVDPLRVDLVDLTANVSAGFGDTLTSGFGLTHLFGVPSLTEWIRSEWTEKVWGGVDAVDPCSIPYDFGKYSAYAWAAITASAQTAEGGTPNWITDKLFRWGRGSWGSPPGPPRLHFHLWPAMRHHLPYQFRTWFFHSGAIILRWLR